MKLSKYTLFYDNYNNVGDTLTYNTRTQGILGVNREVKEFIERVSQSASQPVGQSNRQTGRPEDQQTALNTLLDSGIIVDKEIDEDKALEDWFEEIRFRPRALHATILTTFKCNFACTYCFEESVRPVRSEHNRGDNLSDKSDCSLLDASNGVKDAKTMDDQTADEVIEFLKAKAVEKGSPRIRLMFYGGEPLMNPGVIIKIATALKQWSNERGTKFSFGMITNGSLVKKEIIEQLAKLGLTSIRITLDGDKAVHDKRRPFLDGRGTFDTIVRNIEDVLDASSDVTPAPSSVIPTKVGIQDVPSGLDSRLRPDVNRGAPYPKASGRGNDKIESLVKIELGANFDRDNIAGLHRLLDYLEQKGLNKRISRVLFAPVVSRLAGDDKLENEPVAPERHGALMAPVGCHKLSGELAEEGIKLEKELIQRGYNTPSSVKVSACPMTMDDSMLVIDPSGGLYKCEAFAGREQFCIGNVRERQFNRRYAEFLALKPWKECLECPYVPMCGGGCRYIAQLKHSDYTKRACDKEYYEKIFPQLLKMDYERGVL